PPPVVQARCMGTERLPTPPERSAGGYTATEAARLLATTAARIHAWVRAGFVEPARGPRNEWRFSFQDLVVLRVAQNLAEQLPAARVKRALTRLREQLPTGRGLASVRLSVQGDEVVVHDGASVWKPESGQTLLDFDVARLARTATPLAPRESASSTASPERD